MAYDGWIEFAGRELVNLSRTAQLAVALGIDNLWTQPEDVSWVQAALGGTDYDLISEAPWYDAGHPASAEFAGLVPLAITGMDDSTLDASTVEYLTAGGSSSKPRNKTLPMVANVAVVASTERGADFGKRWLDRVLRGGDTTACSGSQMRYFQYQQRASQPVPPVVHRRDVSVTRGTNVTRKRSTYCSATWIVTYTWTANDPFEYGEPIEVFDSLGGAVTGSYVALSGTVAMSEDDCPVYDYTPVYDPLYPALVTAPEAPDFYPEGWALVPGVDFDRWWVRLNDIEPTALNVVPVLTLTTDFAARYVRVSVWPGDAETDELCGPIWQVIVSYLPAGVDFVIDAEQEAAYTWDGMSPVVRRSDSLAYASGGRPIQWSAFNNPAGLLVTLDVISDSGDYDGSGTVRAALAVVAKSD